MKTPGTRYRQQVPAASVVSSDIQRMAACAQRALAHRDEVTAQAAIRERWPRTGPWLVTHPRALRLLFRVRPGMRPILVYEAGRPYARAVRWPEK